MEVKKVVSDILLDNLREINRLTGLTHSDLYFPEYSVESNLLDGNSIVGVIGFDDSIGSWYYQLCFYGVKELEFSDKKTAISCWVCAKRVMNHYLAIKP